MRTLALCTVLAVSACAHDDASVTCPDEAGDAGAQAATAAELCNVQGSMGKAHYYKLFATAPTDALVVQLELWDNRGAFSGGAAHPGTYAIAGADADPATCGVCLRALSGYGEANPVEFFATSGTVTVDQFSPTPGTPYAATVTGAAFDQIDSGSKTPVAQGCTTTVDHIAIAGTLVMKGGSGGGTGGGGGGGNGCMLTVGDP